MIMVIPLFVGNFISSWMFDTITPYCNITIRPNIMLCSDGSLTTMNTRVTIFLLSWRASMSISGRWRVPSGRTLWPVNLVNLTGTALSPSFQLWGNCWKQCSNMNYVVLPMSVYTMCTVILSMKAWINIGLSPSHPGGVGSSWEKNSLIVVIFCYFCFCVVALFLWWSGARMARISGAFPLSFCSSVFTFYSGRVSTLGMMLLAISESFPFVIHSFISFLKTVHYAILCPCFLWYSQY